MTTKRLRLLHDLVPKAVRIAVLLNPANASIAESTLRDVQETAPTIGLQIQILNASTIGEIDAAFATLARERPDALFVAADAFFVSRAVQFATLTARDRVPATYSLRDYVAAGGLMSYGTDIANVFHQVGVYVGSILKGAKPTDLPVLQSTKFEFAINLQTARALGIEVPSGLLAIVDEVIEESCCLLRCTSPKLARLRRANHGGARPFIGVKRSERLRARNDAIESTAEIDTLAKSKATAESFTIPRAEWLRLQRVDRECFG